MRLIEELEWRGLVNQVTHPELGDRLEQERFTFYCGFDPTAEARTSATWCRLWA